MEVSNALEIDLNNLVHEYGLTSVLAGFKEIIESRAEAIEESAIDLNDQQIEAFDDAIESLSVLIESLPPETDVEIALEQVTRPSLDLEPASEKLSSGLE